ncbi:amidohydrolase family protein [Hydrogenophaga sp.]|uniref:amidohydrolase family protein n=1 Tax=Hydrogenophaga sp. TaxID=1904254 RepID=UPI003F6EC76E
MTRLAITNGSVVTQNAARDIHQGGTVLVENGRIASVLPAGAPVPAGFETLDATGCAVLPGLINAHTHLYASFGRSLSFGEGLIQWLGTQKNLISQFDDEDFHTCIEVGLALNLKSGNTCVVDAMALPAGSEHRYRDALRLAERYKLQYVMARAYTSQLVSPEYVEDLPTIERSMRALIEEFHGSADGRIRIELSPNLPWGLSIEGFRMTRRLADEYGVPIHLHTAESVDYPVMIEKAFGHRSNIQVLQDGHCLGPDVQLLGCATLTDDEFEVIARTGTRVILDPISGTTIGTGEPPVLKVIHNGHPSAVATNGMASAGGQDIFEAMKTMISLARTRGGGADAMPMQRALDMATIESARLLGLEQEIGSLEAGKRADVICVDLANVFCAPTFDVVATLVFACTSRDVRDVIAGGEFAVRDRKLLMADEAELTARATARAGAALQRARHQERVA